MRRAFNPVIAIAGAFFVVTAVWSITTPPFSAPDEWAHYLRALSISHGQVLGRPTPDYPAGGLTPAQMSWVVQATRVVSVPPGLAPGGYGCQAFDSNHSAACNNTAAPPPAEPSEVVIPNGTYQPAAYFVPALLIRLGSTPWSALVFGRLAIAAACALLFSLGLRAQLGGPARSATGLLLACTPMVLFLAGMLNPSGLEVLSAVALFSGLLAVTHAESRAGWQAATVGALVLPLSRSLGAAYLPFVVALWAFWAGPRRLREIWQRSRRPATLFAAVAGTGFVVNRIWERLFGPKVPADTSNLGDAIGSAMSQIPDWLMQQVGNFQWIDTPLPDFAYAAWGAIAVVVLALALARGDWADRRTLVAGLLAAIAIPLAIQVLVLRPTEWYVQGRHVLAITALPMVLAGDVLARKLEGPVLWPFTRVTLAVWIACHVAGIWANAHRSAVGVLGPVWFFDVAEWSPPLGWTVWFVAVAVAVVAVALGVRASSARSSF